MPVEINSDRLTIREFREDDWRDMFPYSSDERVVHYLDWGPSTPAETKAFINRAIFHQHELPRHTFDLAFEYKDTGSVIGHARIRVMYPKFGEGRLHCVLSRDYWGKGFGTEAICALTQFGFSTLLLHRMYGLIDPNNSSTARMFEKARYRREGHLREHKWVKGVWRDSLIYAQLKDEWRAQ